MDISPQKSDFHGIFAEMEIPLPTYDARSSPKALLELIQATRELLAQTLGLGHQADPALLALIAASTESALAMIEGPASKVGVLVGRGLGKRHEEPNTEMLMKLLKHANERLVFLGRAECQETLKDLGPRKREQIALELRAIGRMVALEPKEKRDTWGLSPS